MLKDMIDYQLGGEPTKSYLFFLIKSINSKIVTNSCSADTTIERIFFNTYFHLLFESRQFISENLLSSRGGLRLISKNLGLYVECSPFFMLF